MILDVAERLLINENKAVKISGRQVIFLETLSDGGAVSFNRLIGIIWPQDEPDYALNIVRIVAHQLRQYLPIRSVRAKGFRLDSPLIVQRAGPDPIFIPAERRKDLERLLYSHPDRAAADRVLASMVGG